MCAKLRLALMAVVLVCTVMPLAAAADVVGSYSCRGTNPNGSPYEGTTDISKSGGGYTVSWTIGGQTYSGISILMDGLLSAAWGVPGGAYGVVVYKVQDDGRLVGKWLGPNGGDFGTETLTPR